ncbi:MAG TPA: pilus assembly protein N-terminal domain-containing protein [Galbitalea sp.]|jgi:pilus assembly protein CpaC
MNVHHSVAAALTAAVLVSAAAAPARAQEHLLSLGVGMSTSISAPGMTRVAVGDASIAGVVPTGAQLLINGKAPGRTTVAIWAAAGRLDYEIVVTDPGLDAVEQAIRQAIDIPSIRVSQAPGTILVRGTVLDNTQQLHVNDVLTRFAGYAKDKKVSFVNAVTIADPLGELHTILARDPLTSQVRVEGDGSGNIVVGGSVHDRAEAEAVLARVRSLAGRNLTAEGKIVDRMSTDTTTQIAIKVSILEIDRTGLKQLGISLQGATPDPNNPGSFTLGNPTFVSVEGSGTNIPALNVAPFFRLTRLAPTLDLIVQSGHARILSSPDLVTSPGQEASFLVGGEIPYAFSSGLGQVSIVFKEYGVKLQMTPTLLGNGTVETKIAPEVSDLDFQDGVNLQGFTVPALKTSKLSTDIVTRDGESVVMGGLLRRIEQRNIAKIPLLGDLPILGKLFRSTQYRQSATDVVFIMTPDVIVR